MPRQDVPYGGAICRLKERIAEIWDKLDQKLHSINGVEGDGAGNVDIVSGNAAVVINNDQIGHRIEVSLDSSKLPAAAVSSVNGQTGAVRLDAADIPSDGNSNVQSDIAANKAAINDCFDSITSEQVARQNADATLQTNINAVSARIPDMSITPDIYKGVKRDAQGRAFAADPAAGATDKTLVTANWVSQTGDSGPNNILHKRGAESKVEDLTLYNKLIMRQFGPNSAINLMTPANRSTFNAVFGDMLNWDDMNGNRIVSVRFSQKIDGEVAVEWLFHMPDGSQINIGKFGITANGTVIKTGVFA